MAPTAGAGGHGLEWPTKWCRQHKALVGLVMATVGLADMHGLGRSVWARHVLAVAATEAAVSLAGMLGMQLSGWWPHSRQQTRGQE